MKYVPISEYMIQNLLELQNIQTPSSDLRCESCDQFFEADWKMKTAVRTPTNAVTAKATVGRGLVSPKFCKAKTIPIRSCNK